MRSNHKAFTLVELLIVVTVIGILSGILLNVVDVTKTRGKARDGVRMANMSKLVQGIEAYAISEGNYPTTGGSADITGSFAAGNQQVSATSRLSKYLKAWPDATPSPAYAYKYALVDSNANFVLVVKADRISDTLSCYKYYSADGFLKFCKDAVRCDSNTGLAGCVKVGN